MTPSKKAKQAGLSSLAEVSQMIGKPPQTLNNWFNDEPELFDIVIIGCSVKKHSPTIIKLLTNNG